MRFIKCISLLAALVPFAATQYAPPLPSNTSCAVGSFRCTSNALETCTKAGTWDTVKNCPSTSYCFAQSSGGACHPLLLDSSAQCSIGGTHRCNKNNLQECGEHGYFATKKKCTKTAYCFAQDGVAEGGDCHPLVAGVDKQCSTVGIHQCANNALQECGDHGYWKTKKTCTKTAYCFAQATGSGGGDCHSLITTGNDGQCAVLNAERCFDNGNGTTVQACNKKGYWEDSLTCKGSEICGVVDEEGKVDCVPRPDVYIVGQHKADKNHKPRAVPEECYPGEFSCNKEGSKVLICNAENVWEPSLKCAAPGDCYVDEPGKAYCIVGGMPCTPGEKTCSADKYRILKCNDKKEWDINKTCTLPGDCLVDSLGKARCVRGSVNSPQVKRTASMTTSVKPPPSPMATPFCTPGEQRCFDHGKRVQHCLDNRTWQTERICALPGDCVMHGQGQAHCVRGSVESPEDEPSPLSTAVPDLCNPGETSCDGNAYSLMTCNADHVWETLKKCTTPGDCVIDSPGHARCVRGGIDPPVLLRSSSPSPSSVEQCKPNTLACDSARRFIFSCNSEGQWDAPLQCFGPGYCRPDGSQPLMCAGFPQFESGNDKCVSRCESMDYLYCIGVSTSLFFTPFFRLSLVCC